MSSASRPNHERNPAGPPERTVRRRVVVRARAPENENDPEVLFRAGRMLLERREKVAEALVLLKRAHRLKPFDPDCNSFLGLAIARAQRRIDEARPLCEFAVKASGIRAVHHLNLGRMFLIGRDRRRAYGAFRRGLQVEPGNPAILREMQELGLRRRPLFPILGRSHVVNRMSGRIMSRLGIIGPLELAPRLRER